MKSFYQGKLDVFCAMYAVVNAMQKTHAVSLRQARKVFNDTLMFLPEDQERWRKVVWNQTDYIWLVEWMLDQFGTPELFPLRWARIWENKPIVSPDAFWKAASDWCAADGKTVVLRFARYLPFRGDPIIAHWTTIDRVLGDSMFFLDSSVEDNAVHHLERGGFVTARENVSADMCIHVQPEAAFFIEAI